MEFLREPKQTRVYSQTVAWLASKILQHFLALPAAHRGAGAGGGGRAPDSPAGIARAGSVAPKKNEPEQQRMETVLILGCGRHGRIVAETIAHAGKFTVVGFADDDPAKTGTRIDGIPVLGPWRQSAASVCLVAIGHNETRRRICQEVVRAGRRLLTVISPHAYVSPHATIGAGSVVLAGAVIQAGATLGVGVLANAGAVVDHDAEVGDYVHLGLNATVESFAKVASGEWLAPGTVRLKMPAA